MARRTPLIAATMLVALLVAAPARAEEAEEAGLDEALKAVEAATEQHLEALRGLLDEVPPEARPAIEHAMNVSRHGKATALEAVELARTAAPRERAMLHWGHAERRIAEMQRHTGGRPEFVEALARGYNRSLEGAFEELGRARQAGAGVEEALETVGAATEKHQEVLRRVLGQVPDEARPAILRAMEASSRGRAAALGALRGAPVGPPAGVGPPAQIGPPSGRRPGPPEGVGPPAGSRRDDDEGAQQRRGGPPAGRGRGGRP